jgi:hypothetical protein
MKAKIKHTEFDFRIVEKDDIEPGAPCVVSIGDRLMVGHYYPTADGHDWLVQSGQIIQIPDDEKKQD